jgi:Cu(I)/Ag(I) efflux system membrane fusion protein
MKNAHLKLGIAAASALIAGLLFFQGCRNSKTAEEPADKAGQEGTAGLTAITLKEGTTKIAPVEIGTVERKPVGLMVKASGVVGFNEKKLTCLTARIPGRIEELSAFAGERVRAGAPLIALYSPDFLAGQAEFLQIAGRLERAAKEKDAEAERLAEQMLASAARKLEIMGMAQERVKALADSKSPDMLLTIVAPFDGSVIESHVVKGDYVEMGAELLKLADLGTVWVLANVYEKDLALVEPGAEAEVMVEAYPNKVFKGKVTLIHDTLDEEARTVKARIELVNPGFKLKPGMFAAVTVTPSTTENLLVVPEKAVRQVEGKSVVFVPAGNNRYEARPVKTGRAFPGYIEILEGVKEGDRIVIEGSFTLKSEVLKKAFEGEG